MKCPYCHQNMIDGKSSFFAVQGFGQVIISYESSGLKDGCSQQARAFQKTGDEVEAFYCPNCKKIVSVYSACTPQ